jgi:hypothetical protein
MAQVSTMNRERCARRRRFSEARRYREMPMAWPPLWTRGGGGSMHHSICFYGVNKHRKHMALAL